MRRHANIQNGSPYAVSNNFMQSGSLTIGGTNADYGTLHVSACPAACLVAFAAAVRPPGQACWSPDIAARRLAHPGSAGGARGCGDSESRTGWARREPARFED